MIAQTKNKIELKDNKVIIHDLKIEDINAYRIIKDVKPNRREDFVKKAIVIGTIGLRNLSLTENVDYIEKEFQELLNELESQRINGYKDWGGYFILAPDLR